MKFTGIYIYVDGSDLDDVGSSIVSDLNEWLLSNSVNARVINEKFDKTPDMGSDDYPDWNLGLNFDKAQDVCKELELTIPFMSEIASKYRRDFVIGYYDKESNISEDIISFGYECENNSILEIVEDFLGI